MTACTQVQELDLFARQSLIQNCYSRLKILKTQSITILASVPTANLQQIKMIDTCNISKISNNELCLSKEIAVLNSLSTSRVYNQMHQDRLAILITKEKVDLRLMLRSLKQWLKMVNNSQPSRLKLWLLGTTSWLNMSLDYLRLSLVSRKTWLIQLRDREWRNLSHITFGICLTRHHLISRKPTLPKIRCKND